MKTKSKGKNEKDINVDNKSVHRIVILVLSALGVAVSGYLTYLHYTKAETSFCLSGSGCDIVRESLYSSILGVPVAVFGVIGYSLIFILSLLSEVHRTRWLLLYLGALAGFMFSAYLTYVEIFVINAICSFCVISAVLITGILVVLLLWKPSQSPGTSFAKLIALSAVVGGFVLFGSALLQSKGVNAGSDNTVQSGLAMHLNRIGAVMYGSYQCSHCLAQKHLFGQNAFKHINYVECHPSGKNSNAALCYAKGIESYPTWEISGRFYPGAMSLHELAKISGYSPTDQSGSE